ncbi:MOSC domain-containing protein [Sulfuritalea sp.]|uniref:MOSC domain-containing protein n=1 Tax=Sulfuritalea sp. TaxID=2480090 RepID=UPI00286DFDF1|nr:MOSC domain-containing protein [Sulfuritalea sp.]
MALNPPVLIDGLYAGQVALLAGDSRSSAIVKSAVAGRRQLSADGLAGDTQADRRVHGGGGKALHQFPAEHHARLAAAFPAAQNLAPGGLGENLSTRGMTEEQVCIGDVFRLGGARIQVSQPRTPCWKIDRRTACEGVAAYIAEHGLAGWYYRVLAAGGVAAGDRLEHIERPADAVTLAEFWRVAGAPRPSIAALLRLAYASGLDPQWTGRLTQRAEWLRNNGNAT